MSQSQMIPSSSEAPPYFTLLWPLQADTLAACWRCLVYRLTLHLVIFFYADTANTTTMKHVATAQRAKSKACLKY